MKLNNRELYDLLRDKGVSNFYHSNTVATAMTYIEQGGLLSRKCVETDDLYQTPQTSDKVDKQFDVFDDVFLDTTDLHKHFSRQNHYGPVLFQFSLEILLNDKFEFWVTKDNPINWDEGFSSTDKYFKDVKELSKEWGNYEIQKKMFTIKKSSGPILFDYLECIILDNPKILINGDVSLKKESRKALGEILKVNSNLEAKLVWRACGYCYCSENYLKQIPTVVMAQKFLPQYHSALK